MSGTWSNQRTDLIVLQEAVSGFSGLFGYSPTIGAGNLIFSIAAVAGTDPYGNAYPAGLSITGANSTISGTDYVINSAGAFFYNGTPALGNLILSIAATGGTDSYGNAYGAGLNIETGFLAIAGSLNEFVAAGGNDSFQIFDQGTGLPNLFAVHTTPNGGPYVDLAPVRLLNRASAPAGVAGGAIIYGSGGELAQVTAAGVQTQVPGTQLATFPNTTVTAASLTTLATSSTIYLANDAQAGSVYELEVTGNGVWGSTQQTLEFAVVFGGNTMSNITIGLTQFSASQAFRWKARARVICHTTGATGTWTSEIDGVVSVFNANILGGIGANGTAPFTSSESTTTTTIDTTANQVLSLSAKWGSVTGAPTLTSRVVLARKVN